MTSLDLTRHLSIRLGVYLSQFTINEIGVKSLRLEPFELQMQLVVTGLQLSQFKILPFSGDLLFEKPLQILFHFHNQSL